MHEMGIAQELIRIAIDSIPKDIENPKVQILKLKIGRLAAVVEHSLKFCFEILTKDTILEDVKLDIKFMPVMVYCTACDNKWEVKDAIFACQFCEKNEVEMISGRQIEIVSIELEDLS